MNFESIQSANQNSDFKPMNNISAVAGMVSILALAYALDLLLSLRDLGFVEDVSIFFTWRNNVWLMPISFILFSLAAILLAWYMVIHSKPGQFVRLAFLIVGIAGLLLPTILHTLYALFGYNSVGFLVASTAPILSALLTKFFCKYKA